MYVGFSNMILSVRPDLAKFHLFGKHLKIFGKLFKVYFVLGKVFNSFWHNLYALGQIFFAVNGQILKAQSVHLVTLRPIEINLCSSSDLASMQKCRNAEDDDDLIRLNHR